MSHSNVILYGKNPFTGKKPRLGAASSNPYQVTQFNSEVPIHQPNSTKKEST